MTQPGTPEHQRLREAAFRRGATGADIESLQTYEAAFDQEAPSDGQSDGSASPEPVITFDAVTPEEPPHHRHRPRLVLAIAIALVLFSTGWLLGLFAYTSTPTSSLRIFESPGIGPSSKLFVNSLSDPTAPFLIPQSRLLGEIDGQFVFGGLGLMVMRFGEEDDPEFSEAVCISTEDAQGFGGVACTPLTAFRNEGVGMDTGDVAIKWGPTGDAQIRTTND